MIIAVRLQHEYKIECVESYQLKLLRKRFVLDTFKNGVVSETEEAARNSYNSGSVEKPDYKSSIMDVLKHPDYHQNEFSVGIGFTW